MEGNWYGSACSLYNVSAFVNAPHTSTKLKEKNNDSITCKRVKRLEKEVEEARVAGYHDQIQAKQLELAQVQCAPTQAAQGLGSSNNTSDLQAPHRELGSDMPFNDNSFAYDRFFFTSGADFDNDTFNGGRSQHTGQSVLATQPSQVFYHTEPGFLDSSSQRPSRSNHHVFMEGDSKFGEVSYATPPSQRKA